MVFSLFFSLNSIGYLPGSKVIFLECRVLTGMTLPYHPIETGSMAGCVLFILTNLYGYQSGFSNFLNLFFCKPKDLIEYDYHNTYITW